MKVGDRAELYKMEVEEDEQEQNQSLKNHQYAYEYDENFLVPLGYDEDPSFPGGKLLMVVIVCCVGCIISAVLCISAMKFFFEINDLINLAGGLPVMTGLVLSIVFSTVSLVVSVLFLGKFAYPYMSKKKDLKDDLKRVRRVGIRFFRFMILLSLLQSIGAILFLVLHGNMKTAVTTPVDGEVSDSLLQKVNDFDLALFNKCCAANGWTMQGPAAKCVGTRSVDCASLPSIVRTYEDKLCACYDSQERYDQFFENIDSSMCDRLQDARVFITSDQLLLGTDFTVRQVVALLYPDGRDDWETMPVVGFHKNDDVTGDQYGCGLGFVKGFMFIFWGYFEQENKKYALALLGIAMVQVAASIFGALLVSMVEDSSFLDEFRDQLAAQQKRTSSRNKNDDDAEEEDDEQLAKTRHTDDGGGEVNIEITSLSKKTTKRKTKQKPFMTPLPGRDGAPIVGDFISMDEALLGQE